jgi:PAS domain S-box-containing protein
MRRAMRTSAQFGLRLLLAFAVIFAAGVLGFALPRFGGSLPLLILPSGFAVAAMYRWGRRLWPAVFAAGTVTDLWVHQPLVTALAVGMGLAAGAALSAWLLERGDFDPSFGRGKDVVMFILAAAFGMMVPPSLGLFGAYLADPGPTTIHIVDWVRWWSNTTVGVLLVAPALVAITQRSFAQFASHRLAGSAWALGVILCCAAISVLPNIPAAHGPIVVAAVFLVVIGAINFGLVPAALAAFFISMLVAISVAFETGAFQVGANLQGLAVIWSFIATLSGIALIITALLAERDSAGLARLRAEQRYAQVFEGSPQPTWVHDAASLRFLMVNEAALRQYGWSREELLSMNVTALVCPGESQTPVEGEGENTPIEMRHLTRDGRILEVEVWSRRIEFMGNAAVLIFAFDVTDRRAFGRALVEAVAGEQRRIGQEMHDGLGQELTGLALTARALANRASRERDAIAEDLDQLALLATSCIQDARLIVQGLSPLTDSDGNLEAALEALAARSSLSGTPVRFQVQREAPLAIDLKVRNHLYRIAQEAVQNALKHSGARSIDIDLKVRDGSVRLEVQDDGRGLSALDARGAGLGMRTMRFRSSAIGGRLALTPRAGGGNSVVCEVPQERAWPPIQRLAT